MSLIVGVYFARVSLSILFFFFNDTATTEIYTLSLHDALPISAQDVRAFATPEDAVASLIEALRAPTLKPDRKSTRLNSSHGYISYAVFCLKKKKKKKNGLTNYEKKKETKRR